MIRPATQNDAQRVVEIYNHYIESTIVTFEENPVGVSTMAERIAETQRSLPFLVAENEENRLAAFAYASIWKSRGAYCCTAETTIYVAPESIGKGLGTMLYPALIAELRARSFHALLGGIALPNEGSVALHEKFGFEKVAHLKQVGWKFSKWIDVGYWELIL
ncbi:MAG: GNAT family N-acetyltransferase [Roseibacillus sp.]|jgi:phosphinothricin acetyltransferase